MLALAVVIPIVCCILIPAVIGVAAFFGFRKKTPSDNAGDSGLPQENASQSTRLE